MLNCTNFELLVLLVYHILVRLQEDFAYPTHSFHPSNYNLPLAGIRLAYMKLGEGICHLPFIKLFSLIDIIKLCVYIVVCTLSSLKNYFSKVLAKILDTALAVPVKLLKVTS